MNKSGVIIGIATFFIAVLICLVAYNTSRSAYAWAGVDLVFIIINAIIIGVNIALIYRKEV